MREINLLINLSKQINRHIVFVYALKDEMFLDGNRTKFFDFIIPIIPVINSSNSFEFLFEKLGNNEIDENLLDDISLYIDDMRLLKNIVNEYKIYFEKLTKETNINLSANKLLSFVVYKNLYPKDFAKLHRNEGMVYKLFNSDSKILKDKFIEEQLAEIVRIRKKILEIEDVKIENIYDLRRLYILKIFEKLGKKATYIKLSKNYSVSQIDELIKDEVFDEIIGLNSFSYIEERYNSSWSRYDELNPVIANLSFKQVEKEIDVNLSYLKKADLISAREDNEIHNYNKSIQTIRDNINKIRRSSIEETLKISNSIDDINEELRKSDVLIYLIRKGFIAEDYFDYISIFYDITITRNDKNFILSIRDNKPLSIDFKLDKIEAVVKKTQNDYDKEATLNIHLVDYLFEKENYDAITILFSQFNNKTERTINFIENYALNGKHISRFTNSVCKLYQGFWDFIEGTNFSDYDKDFVLKQILLYADNSDVINLNASSKLSNYISQKADFLNLFPEKSEKVKEILLQLNIKFKYPQEVKANEDLFDFIYQNNLYEINEDLIKQVVVEKSEEDNIVVNDLKKSNYSTILLSKCSQLIKYVNQNISVYINNVFLRIDSNIKEEEKNIINLLNNKNLDDEDKFLIIDKEEFILSKLDDVESGLIWKYLLEKDKVKPTWENIITYCGEDVFDDTIISYLNKENHFSELSKSNITDEDIEDEFKSTFIHNLITANDLTNEAYKALLQIIDEPIGKIEFGLLSEDKIEILISMDFVELNDTNMEELRLSSIHKQILLIELNFDKYIEQRDDTEIDEEDKIELTIEEIESLLSLESLANSNKIKLISEIEENQITEKNNLGNLLNQVLIRNVSIELSFSYLDKILKFSSNINDKVKLCNLYSKLFLSDRAKIESVLNILGSPFSNIVIGGVKPPINASDWNLNFIEKLKRAGYINSYSAHDGIITKIRKR
nr:hypothetical protein [Flavobacterium phycosphaerae]